jgi:hypothetical protein
MVNTPVNYGFLKKETAHLEEARRFNTIKQEIKNQVLTFNEFVCLFEIFAGNRQDIDAGRHFL